MKRLKKIDFKLLQDSMIEALPKEIKTPEGRFILANVWWEGDDQVKVYYELCECH